MNIQASTDGTLFPPLQEGPVVDTTLDQKVTLNHHDSIELSTFNYIMNLLSVAHIPIFSRFDDIIISYVSNYSLVLF